MLGKTIKPVPNIVVASAPKYNCPSAPIFQNFALKAIEAAKPVKIIGVALARSPLKHFLTQKLQSLIDSMTEMGLLQQNIKIPANTIATNMAIKGDNIKSQ